MGIKWSFMNKISEYDDESGSGLATILIVNQYYITATEAKWLITDSIAEIEDEIGAYNFTSLFVYGGVLALSTRASTAVGLCLLFLEASDMLMGELLAGRINDLQEFFIEAERLDLAIVIQDTNYTVITPYTMDYYQHFTTSVFDLGYISMSYASNGVYTGYLSPNDDNYGIVSYIEDTNEIIQMIQFSVKYNYPTFLPWNW